MYFSCTTPTLPLLFVAILAITQSNHAFEGHLSWYAIYTPYHLDVKESLFFFLHQFSICECELCVSSKRWRKTFSLLYLNDSLRAHYVLNCGILYRWKFIAITISTSQLIIIIACQSFIMLRCAFNLCMLSCSVSVFLLFFILMLRCASFILCHWTHPCVCRLFWLINDTSEVNKVIIR